MTSFFSRKNLCRFQSTILILLWGVVTGVVLPGLWSSEGRAASYFIDASKGNDNNSGTTSNAAWKSLDRIMQSSFAPGDQILLKRGELWTGQLKIRSEGKPNMPIIIGDYGNGKKPEISGGMVGNGLSLDGKSFITIKNLAISNAGGSGITITESNENGKVSIESCDIYHNAKDGITIKDRGNTDIVNCNIYDNNHNGVSAYYSQNNNKWSDKKGSYIKIIESKIYNNKKNGVYLAGDRAIIQKNELFANGSSPMDHNFYLMGDNGLVEHNIFREANYGLGFRYEGSNLIFRNNVVKKNPKHGIGLWNDFANEQYNNKISHNIIEVEKLPHSPVNFPMAIAVGKDQGKGNFDGIDLDSNSIQGSNDGGGGIWLAGCSKVIIKKNSLHLKNGYLIYLEGKVAGIISNFNDYFCTKGKPFVLESQELSFPEWQQLGLDQNSTIAEIKGPKSE